MHRHNGLAISAENFSSAPALSKSFAIMRRGDSQSERFRSGEVMPHGANRASALTRKHLCQLAATPYFF